MSTARALYWLREELRQREAARRKRAANNRRLKRLGLGGEGYIPPVLREQGRAP